MTELPGALAPVVRVPLIRPFSPTERVVVMLLGIGHEYGDIAEDLSMRRDTVRFHAVRAARKIPGDLPTQVRCIAWARGADMGVLSGDPLRVEIVRAATDFSVGDSHPARLRNRRRRRRLAAEPAQPATPASPSET